MSEEPNTKSENEIKKETQESNNNNKEEENEKINKEKGKEEENIKKEEEKENKNEKENIKEEENNPPKTTKGKNFNIDDYILMLSIGTGNFSEVHLVEHKTTKILYALKSFEKR